MKLKVEEDRIIQLKEMSEFLGIDFNPNVDDLRNFPDFNGFKFYKDDVKQSERSKNEKSLVDTLDETTLNELLDVKFQKPMTQRDKLFIEFSNERLSLVQHISRLKVIIDENLVKLTYMLPSEEKKILSSYVESLKEMEYCVNEMMGTRIISNSYETT